MFHVHFKFATAERFGVTHIKNYDNKFSPSRLSRPWTLERALRRSAGLMSTLDRRLTREPASWGVAEETGAVVLREGGGRAAAGGLSADGDTRLRLKRTL